MASSVKLRSTIIIDAISDVNRANPDDSSKLAAPDYANMTLQTSQFLLDKDYVHGVYFLFYDPSIGPDTLDVRRHPERHVAFAAGIHFCLGAWLARLEARVVLDTVLRRLPDLALAPGEPRWKPMIYLRGLEALPLEWRCT